MSPKLLHKATHFIESQDRPKLIRETKMTQKNNWNKIISVKQIPSKRTIEASATFLESFSTRNKQIHEKEFNAQDQTTRKCYGSADTCLIIVRLGKCDSRKTIRQIVKRKLEIRGKTTSIERIKQMFSSTCSRTFVSRSHRLFGWSRCSNPVGDSFSSSRPDDW